MTRLDTISLGCAGLCVAAYASGDLHTFDVANAVLGWPIGYASLRHKAWAALVLNITFTLVAIVGLLTH